MPPDIGDAVYRTVHDFGVERLAQLTGTPAGTIWNKANRSETSHHLTTLADAVLWQVLSRDYRILAAVARTLGHVCFKLPDLSNVSDVALLELLAKAGADEGEFFGAIQHALQDGKFTRREFEGIRHEAWQAAAAIFEACARIEGLVDE